MDKSYISIDSEKKTKRGQMLYNRKFKIINKKLLFILVTKLQMGALIKFKRM